VLSRQRGTMRRGGEKIMIDKEIEWARPDSGRSASATSCRHHCHHSTASRCLCSRRCTQCNRTCSRTSIRSSSHSCSSCRCCSNRAASWIWLATTATAHATPPTMSPATLVHWSVRVVISWVRHARTAFLSTSGTLYTTRCTFVDIIMLTHISYKCPDRSLTNQDSCQTSETIDKQKSSANFCKYDLSVFHFCVTTYIRVSLGYLMDHTCRNWWTA